MRKLNFFMDETNIKNQNWKDYSVMLEIKGLRLHIAASPIQYKFKI